MDEMKMLLDALAEVNEDLDYAAHDALIDDGLIDSFDLMRIIAALDDTFGIHINTGDIEPENFNSVQAMLDLVHSCQANQ